MVRPWFALTMLLSSLGCVLVVVGTAQCQPNCSKQTANSDHPLSCPHRGPGMYIFRIPYDEEQGLDPAEERLILQPTTEEKLETNENAAIIENMEDAAAREHQASDLLPNKGSNLPVNSAAPSNEAVENDAAPTANDLLDEAAVMQIRLLSVNPIEVQPIRDPAGNENGVTEIDAATESFDGNNAEGDNAVTNTTENQAAPINNEQTSDAPEATTEEEDANWESPTNEAEEAEQLKGDLYFEQRTQQNGASQEQASFLQTLNAKLILAMNSEWAVRAQVELQLAREQFSYVVRNYRFDQLTIEAANRNIAIATEAEVVAKKEAKLKDWQMLLGLARGLREIGSLAEFASRHLENMVHDGIHLQADAHADSIEVRK